MGTVHGALRRYPPYYWDEGTLSTTEGNDREALWNSQGESRIPIHTAIRKALHGDESRAYICVYESQETGKDEGKDGADRTRFFAVRSKILLQNDI